MGRFATNLKLDEIKRLAEAKQYMKAMKILDTLNVDKIRKMADLMVIADVLMINEKYEEAMEVLLRIYEKSCSRKIIEILIELSVRMKNYEEADEFFRDYLRIAPKDPYRWILKYRLDKAKHVSNNALIDILESLKREDYSEEWAYELAKLYHKTKQIEKCVDECNDIVLWFGQGIIVDKAKLLREHYTDGLNLTEGFGAGEFDATRSLEEVIRQVKLAQSKKRESSYHNVQDENSKKSEKSEKSEISENSENLGTEFPLQEETDYIEPSISETYPLDGNRLDESYSLEEQYSPLPLQPDSIVHESYEETVESYTEEVNGIHGEEISENHEEVGGFREEESGFHDVEIDKVKEEVYQEGDQGVSDCIDSPQSVSELREVAVTSETKETKLHTLTEQELERIKRKMRKLQNSSVARDTNVIDGMEGSPDVAEGKLEDPISNVNLEKIFKNFIEIKSIKNQILSIIHNMDMDRKKINFLVCGDARTGKTTLSRSIAATLFKMGILHSSKIAKISATKLNTIDLPNRLQQLADGAMVIEHAGMLEATTVKQVIEMIEHLDGRIIVFLEDRTRNLEDLLKRENDLRQYFSNRIIIPIYGAKDLVGFAKNIATQKEYTFAEEALITLEDMMGQLIKVVAGPEQLGRVNELVTDIVKRADTRNMLALMSQAKAGRFSPRVSNLIIEEDLLQK